MLWKDRNTNKTEAGWIDSQLPEAGVTEHVVSPAETSKGSWVSTLVRVHGERHPAVRPVASRWCTGKAPRISPTKTANYTRPHGAAAFAEHRRSVVRPRIVGRHTRYECRLCCND